MSKWKRKGRRGSASSGGTHLPGASLIQLFIYNHGSLLTNLINYNVKRGILEKLKYLKNAGRLFTKQKAIGP